MSYQRRFSDGRLQRRLFLGGAICAGLSLPCAATGLGQEGPNSSLYSGNFTAIARTQDPPSGSAATTMIGRAPQQQQSWYEVPLPPPKEVRLYDIITIRVDTGARVSSQAQLQRRRTAQYDARLNDWIFLEGLRAVRPAPQSDGDQRVQGNLN